MSRLSRIIFSLMLLLPGGCGSSTPAPAQSTDGTLRYLALGDSYTIGRGVAVAGRWPVQLAAALRAAGKPVAEPTILARSGWTSGQLLSALGNGDGEKYDLVSLLIGVNNQYQALDIEAYRRDLHRLFKIAIARSHRGPRGVFVLSIPDYGATPFGAADAVSIGQAIDRWNRVYRQTAAQYKLRFFDITGISRRGAGDDSLISFDRLHPSAAMYRLWVQSIAADVAAMLDD